MISDALSAFFRGTTAPPGVAAAYLFGSHAAGRAHRESDVDVAVLLDHAVWPDRPARDELRIRLGSQLIQTLHRNAVDLVILNDVSPELGARAVTAGNRVFCSDEEASRAFVRDVQLRAADLAPWLERMRRIKLERLIP